MKVIVIAKKWGRYVEGDSLEMYESTALACKKVGVVRLEDEEETVQKKSKKQSKKQ
jgi:hypothetical protein